MVVFTRPKLSPSSSSDPVNPPALQYHRVATLLTFLYIVFRRPGRISIRVGIAVLHNSSLLVLVIHRGWGRRRRRVIEHRHLVGGRWGGRSRAISNWKRWEIVIFLIKTSVQAQTNLRL